MLVALVALLQAHAAPYTHAAGWTATLPDGWSVTADDAQRVVLVHADGVRSVIATVTFADWATTRAELSNPIDLGGGVQLVPTEPPRESDGVVRATYAVPAAAQPLSGFTEARALDGERVVILIGFAPTERIGDLADVVHAMTASVRAPQIAPDAPNSWSSYLRDSHWVQRYTRSGYSERHDLWLCANGTYRRHDDLGGFSMDGMSGGAATESSGTWQVAGTASSAGQLRLLSDAGARVVVSLIRDGDAVKVDGVRWLRAGPASCR